jgi:hypothetical protein
MKIYLAGPMTGYEDLNFPLFHSTTAALRAAGHEVINPAEIGQVDGWSWEDYMRADLAAVLTVECVATLLGWSQSRGAMLEVHVARSLGLIVESAELLLATDSRPLGAPQSDQAGESVPSPQPAHENAQIGAQR